MSEHLELSFFGRQADDGQIDLYDAGRCVTGLGRTVAILAEFYQSGRIIVQAPSSAPQINLFAPKRGSFTLDVSANVAGALISVPFVLYLNYVFQQWIPGNNAEQGRKLERLRNRLAVQEARSETLEKILLAKASQGDLGIQLEQVRKFIEARDTEHAVLRSITARSFAEVFRPIGRSADFATVAAPDLRAYGGIIDKQGVDELDMDIADEDMSEVRAVVTAFSTNSKTGVALSPEMGRGFRFSAKSMGKIGAEDDFSWSQYRALPVFMTGRFYRFFDGSIKRLEVVAVERSE